jgi:hypothetical protein
MKFLGAPESVETSEVRGRGDDAPVACEREILWPIELADEVGVEILEKLYGDIPRRTRLYVREVCRRLRCDSNSVHRYIDEGLLDATNIGRGKRPEYRVYRESLVRFLFERDFVVGRTRAGLPMADLDRVLSYVESLPKGRMAAAHG